MAGPPPSLGTQFMEELTCSICHEDFTRPKMLPCQHTFCQNCLQRVLGRERIFKCPVCGRKGRLPRHGVAGLPDNTIVANLCAKSHFQPEDTPVPVLEHMTVQSLPSTATSGVGGGRGHHHGNQQQRENRPQKVTIGGRRGSEPGQFAFPIGVTVSDEGEIFVAEEWNKRIQVFTLEGTFVRQFPTVVSGGEEKSTTGVDCGATFIQSPSVEYGKLTDIASTEEGNLWVVGRTVSRIAEFAVQYNKQGRMLRRIDLQATSKDRGVAVDTRRNHILVAQVTRGRNYQHGEVQLFRPDGTLVRTVGQEQGMIFPCYITVDWEGNILVSDWGSHRVYVYNGEGQFLFKFGGEGSREGQLNHPTGICTDRAGNIIVADLGNHRVELFAKTGTFLKHITTDMEPWAVAMAPQGQLVVTEASHYDNETVSIFYNY